MSEMDLFQHARCCYHKGEAPECLWLNVDGPCCPHCTKPAIEGGPKA